MTDAAKAFTKRWAEEFSDRYGRLRDGEHMRDLIERERKTRPAGTRVMIRMPFDLLVTALIHYTSGQIAREKVKEVSLIAAEKVTRREYWNKLDRAHHFVAGLLAASDELQEAGADRVGASARDLTEAHA